MPHNLTFHVHSVITLRPVQTSKAEPKQKENQATGMIDGIGQDLQVAHENHTHLEICHCHFLQSVKVLLLEE